ncbi:MAG: IS982 family transposase [Bacteroidales bacterium]|nr:IS982 family transposase [Bacteroidales bacterium]
MSDSEVISLSILGETIGIDSENYPFGKIKSDHHKDFPNLISRSRFNRRRKRLGDFIARLNYKISFFLNQGEDVYLVDSIPVPICQIAREKSCKICKEKFETAPDKGYSAVSRSWYFGYKLHMATSVRGVFSSMDLTKASVHDIHYLNEVKHSGITNCILIADKAYISEPIQLDLFTTKQIRLETSLRSNQHFKEHLPFIFKKSRKRIETLFSQLCDQLMLKRNYAKTMKGLSIRILCKITAVTLLQYINYKNEKPLNHLKYALAS